MTKSSRNRTWVPVPHSLLWVLDRHQTRLPHLQGWVVLTLLMFIGCLTGTSVALADSHTPKAGEQIKWQVIAGGGTTNGSSTNYRLSTTVGQTAVGSGASTNYKINQGFQQSFVTTTYTCGDANGDGSVDISDAVFLIAYIFSGGSAPSPLLAGDANCDSAVDISDAVYLIAYIFSGGSEPCHSCK